MKHQSTITATLSAVSAYRAPVRRCNSYNAFKRQPRRRAESLFASVGTILALIGVVERQPPRLLDKVRHAIRLRHYSRRTEEAYVEWIRRYIVFHGKRHPRELGAPGVTAFLSSLATRGVSASTQNQALSSLLFLYEVVFGERLGWMNDVVRAQRPARLPVVLARSEVSLLLAQLRGPVWLMASLMYGAGLRLLECVELRVKDADFERGELTIRGAKGGKDRVTMLPAVLKEPLRQHLARVKTQHQADLVNGRGPFVCDASARGGL